jgi:hypothetical protein
MYVGYKNQGREVDEILTGENLRSAIKESMDNPGGNP